MFHLNQAPEFFFRAQIFVKGQEESFVADHLRLELQLEPVQMLDQLPMSV